MPKTGRMQRQMQHRAALAFDYDGLRASGSDEKPLTRLVDNTSQRIRRQPQAEQALRKVLRDLGFKAATRQSKALPDSAGEMLQLPDDEAWLRFAREGLPRLREAGWNIDIHRDFAFNLQEVDDWYASIDEAPGSIWSWASWSMASATACCRSCCNCCAATRNCCAPANWPGAVTTSTC
jgi:hypothetical protein